MCKKVGEAHQMTKNVSPPWFLHMESVDNLSYGFPSLSCSGDNLGVMKPYTVIHLPSKCEQIHLNFIYFIQIIWFSTYFGKFVWEITTGYGFSNQIVIGIHIHMEMYDPARSHLHFVYL